MPEPRSVAHYPPGLPALFEVVRRLRAPGGCPWDREQTHQSLRPYLLEETYEVLEAIDSSDDAKFLEELGDLLLQVAMHAEIASETGRFDAGRVSEAAAAKMVARHPHVFGEVEVADATEVLRNWERKKADEASAAGRIDESPLDRVPRAMPALAWALGLQKRAARVGGPAPGSDPRSPDYLEGVIAATSALARSAVEGVASAGDDELFERFGSLLFTLVVLARTLRVDPEDALRRASQRYLEDFKASGAAEVVGSGSEDEGSSAG